VKNKQTPKINSIEDSLNVISNKTIKRAFKFIKAEWNKSKNWMPFMWDDISMLQNKIINKIKAISCKNANFCKIWRFVECPKN